MKNKECFLIMLGGILFSASFALATHHTAEERGMAHFNNPEFAGGKKSCSTCHPNGRGLSNAGAKTEFFIMGSRQASLEEAVNVCIVNANKGNPIDEESPEMQDIVAYIKSLAP